MSEGHAGMTRRDFAKTAAAAASFAILSSRGAAAQANSETLKVGLIGCGGRGTGAAMNMLQGNDNVQLIALADVFPDRVENVRNTLARSNDPAIQGKHAITDDHCFVGFNAYKDLLATDIDIVLDGSLPYCRPDHLVAAVDAKKHIFTEKPVAVDPVGIRKVIAAAEKHKAMGLSWVSGTQRRHQSAYIDAIKRIHDGGIGEVMALRAYWCGGLPFVHDQQPGWSELEYRIRNWYSYCWLCGDNIVEQHVHNIDVCNWIMGAHPTAVFASGGRTWKPNTEKYGDIWDSFSCDYEYDNGVFMTSMSRHWDGCDGGVFETAKGTKGSFDSRKDVGESPVNPYVQEHINLVNSIRGTGPKYHEGVQVSESTLTAIMGRMSAYTGKRITWDEALNSDLNLVPSILDWSKEYPVGPIPVPVAKDRIR